MDKKIKYLCEFDNFRLDLLKRLLWRDETPVSLTPKAFETLALLIENKGRVVEKDTFLDEVWKDTFVEEATLAQNISTLRKALRDGENDKAYIETVARRGYKFIGEVREVFIDEEVLVMEKNSRTHFVAEREIGQSPGDHLDSAAAMGDKPAFNLQPSASLPGRKRIRQSRNNLLIKIIIAVIGAAAIAIIWGAGGTRFFQSRGAVSKFNRIQMTRLTFSGAIVRAAISPDGKYVALIEKKNDEQSLQVRQTDDSATLEIVPPGQRELTGITFSADSRQIYYVSRDSEKAASASVGVLFKVSILGGTPQQQLADIDSPVSFAPNNRQLAFLRNYPQARESAVMIADLDGGNEKKLAVRRLRERFLPDGLAWSPDGKTIVCPALAQRETGSFTDIVAIEVAGGAQQSLVSGGDEWLWMGQPAWLEDGSGIIFPAFKNKSENLTDEIWIAAYPPGKTRYIMSGLNGFYGLSTTSDSRLIAAVQSSQSSSFWTMSLDNAEQAKKIAGGLSEISLFRLGMTVVPDGRLIYSSAQNGNADLWMMNADGSSRRQLTFDAQADYSPVISADGSYVIFLSNRSGTDDIWRMDLNGERLQKLTSLRRDIPPSISAGDKWVYYTAMDEKSTPVLWKIPIEGVAAGGPLQITTRLTINPTVSPDGKMIGCYFPGQPTPENNSNKLRLTVLSAADGKVLKQFGEFDESLAPALVWTPDSRNVTYAMTSGGISNIWSQPVDGAAAPRPLTAFQSDEIFRFAWAADGKTLIFDRGTSINDIVLIKEAGE